MPTAGEVLILLAAVFGSGAMVAVGGWFMARLRRLEAAHAQQDELQEQVEFLREQLAVTREEIAELGERVEFAERLLTGGTQPPGRPE